jgi:quercetin dioxygenase-like cupin family protein
VTETTEGPRRVVVGPGPEVADDRLAPAIENEAVRISDIWLTKGGAKTTDYAPGLDPWSLVPAEHGATWRIVEFKSGHAPQDITTGMHATPTVDLGVVLSGHVTLVLEDASTVELTAGDYFVLRGAQHTWVNAGEESCVLAIALVHAY